MLLYIGNSRWTNSSKGHAVHICGINRRPLCKKSYRNGVLDIYDGKFTEVTCNKCKKEFLSAIKDTKEILNNVENYINT